MDIPVLQDSVRYQRGHSADIRVTSLISMPEIRAFANEWARFAETAGALNPFTHPDCLMPWAERFLRPSDQIWLLTARQQNRLVGVAPFYRRSSRPGLAHSMQLWGTGPDSRLIELPQLLLDQEQPRAAARALVAWLCSGAVAWDWAVVPLENPLWLEPEWLPRGGKVTVLTKTVRASVVLPITRHSPPPLKRNVRESLRRSHNRLDRAFPGQWSVSRTVGGADLCRALQDLAVLHADRSRMAGKERHPNALARPAEWSFLSAWVNALAERGGVCLYRLLVRDRAIAALLVLRTQDCTYFLLSGMNEQSWEFSPTTLLQWCAIEDAVALGHRRVNVSAGPDTAKLRWSEQLAKSVEFILTPNRAWSRIAFAGFWQMSAAMQLARERNRHTLLPQR
jgi:CelD/BcsL family acetyltransferase involved in cellulose biosynthesis